MGVTIKEVAKEAGVSIATVSRVFNDSGPVNDNTREKIMAVARRLRYTPHGGARSLIMAKTNTLGVLLPDLYGEFFSEVIRGIDQAARSAGYQVLLSSSHNRADEIETAMKAMRGRVDGLIVMYPDIDAGIMTASLSDSMPVVLLNCDIAGDDYMSINVDNYSGAYAMVEHLIAVGHRRIAMIKGAANNFDAAERLRGYRTAMKDGNAEWSEALEYIGDFTEASGFSAAEDILDLDPRPTAIFAANDAAAIGALSAVRQRGFTVPDDVAIAGFDDIPMAGYINPPLTSVHVPINELGARAIARLIDAVSGSGDAIEKKELLPTTLVIRESSGPHRTDELREARGGEGAASRTARPQNGAI